MRKGKSHRQKSVLYFTSGRTARFVRVPARGRRLAIPMSRDRCHHLISLLRDGRRLLAGGRRRRREASSSDYTSNMSILIARLGTYRATSARLQKLDPGEDGNFANLSLGFSLILKGKRIAQRLKTQVFYCTCARRCKVHAVRETTRQPTDPLRMGK